MNSPSWAPWLMIPCSCAARVSESGAMKASRQVLQAVRADWSAFVMAASLDSSLAVQRVASPAPDKTRVRGACPQAAAAPGDPVHLVAVDAVADDVGLHPGRGIGTRPDAVVQELGLVRRAEALVGGLTRARPRPALAGVVSVGHQDDDRLLLGGDVVLDRGDPGHGGPPALAMAPVWPFVQTLSNHALMSMSEFAIGVPPAARMPPWDSSMVVVAALSAAGQVRAVQVPSWCLPSRTRACRRP